MQSRKFVVTFAAAAATVGLVKKVQADILYAPVVTQVGDGTTALSSAGATTTIQVYQPSVANQPSPVAQLAYGNGNLVNTGNSTTEAALVNNPTLMDDAAAGLPYTGTAYIFSGGYAANDGTAAVDGTAAAAGRVAGSMIVTSSSVGSPAINVTQPAASAYTASNIRGVVGNDADTAFWAAGTSTTAANAGYRYFSSNTQLVASPGPINTRTVQIRNGQLYGSSDTGAFIGISSIGTGTPTTSGQTATSLFESAANSSVGSPTAFVLFDNTSDPTPSSSVPYNVAYIADNGSAPSAGGNPGIEKWVYSPSTGTNNGWSLAYVIDDNATTPIGYLGLAGQLDGSSVVLYATTATSPTNALEQYTDPLAGGTAAGTDSSLITLATSATDDAFRGVALAPVVPEPATVGLLCAGTLGLLARRRRGARS
jgi:hypothetical protein